MIIEQNPKFVFETVDAFTQVCLLKDEDFSDIQNIQKTISEIIELYCTKQNPELVSKIVDAFAEACLSKEKRYIPYIQQATEKIIKKIPDFPLKPVCVSEPVCSSQKIDISNIQQTILKITRLDYTKQNPESKSNTIDGFAQVSLSKGKNILDIQPTILDIIKQNPKFVFKTVKAFTQTCLSEGKNISDIKKAILVIIEQNPKFVFETVDAFTQVCLLKDEDFSDIQNIQKTISEIIELYCTKQNPELVSKIVDAFAEACLSKEKRYIPYIQQATEKIIKKIPDFPLKPVCVSEPVCSSQKIDISNIQQTILKITRLDYTKQNPESKSNTIDGFIQVSLSEGKNILDIQPTILYIMKKNTESVFKIVNALTQACLSRNENISDILLAILYIMKENTKLVFKVTNTFIQA